MKFALCTTTLNIILGDNYLPPKWNTTGRQVLFVYLLKLLPCLFSFILSFKIVLAILNQTLVNLVTFFRSDIGN